LRGEVEYDADVLLSLSALIKARELWLVFEGILLKKTLQLRYVSCGRLRRGRSHTVPQSFLSFVDHGTAQHTTYNLMSLPRNDNEIGEWRE